MTASALDTPLRARFRDLDTAVLLALWHRDERVPQAETALRDELRERGVAEDELAAIVGRRAGLAAERAMSERETLGEFGLLGRFVSLVLSLGIGQAVQRLVGTRAGLGVAGLILAIYVVVLFRRVLRHLRRGASGRATFGMVLMMAEGALLGLLALALAWFAIMGSHA